MKAAWNVILEHAAEAASEGRYLHSLAFSVSGLKERDEEATGALLDQALSDELLQRIFVPMQTYAGIETKGCARLVQAAAIPAVPTQASRR